MSCFVDCTSCCDSYSITVNVDGHSQFWGETFTVSKTGSFCHWTGNSDGDPSCHTATLFCTSGIWTLVLADTCVDCKEVFSGSGTDCPPTSGWTRSYDIGVDCYSSYGSWVDGGATITVTSGCGGSTFDLLPLFH